MVDKSSPIADFYPRDVDVDPNGKAMPWLHVVLLPFVDQPRLVRAVSEAVAKTTAESDRRIIADATTRRDAVVSARKTHPVAAAIASNANLPAIVAGVIVAASSSPEEDGIARASLKPLPAPPGHVSKILPGAHLPPPTLRGDDRLPRQAPRLGRRGAAVAELGLSSAGMNVAGQRSWGTLEPAPKRHRVDPGHALIQRPRSYDPPPPPPRRHSFGHPSDRSGYAYYPTYPHHHQQQQQRSSPGYHPHQQQQQQQRGGYAQQPQYHYPPPQYRHSYTPPSAAANVASADTIREQLAAALRQRNQGR